MIADLAQQLAEMTGFGYWFCYVSLKVTLALTIFVPLISIIAVFAIWGERKVAGHIQGRFGPKHVGPFGLFQSPADGIKLLFKEDTVPGNADQFLFRFAPYVAFAPVFAAFLIIPYGPQFIFEEALNIGILYLLAILSIEIMAVILAGWGSNSKWALYGAMREACQMVSYEIPLGIAILCGVLVAGTLNLTAMSYMQGGGLHTWLIFHNPFMFIAFFIYFIASLASAKRAPFDLPESESELVAGFHVEYSGMRWAMFFFAEYGGMFIIGCIQAVLFLGGWNSPFGPIDWVYMFIGYDPVQAGSLYLTGELAVHSTWADTAAAMDLRYGWFGLFIVNAYGAFWVMLKATIIVIMHLWIRWTLPRIRIDQVMHGCIKGLLPVSLAILTGTALWVAFVNPIATGDPLVASTSIFRTANLSHLTGDVSLFQLITQIILTLAGVALVGVYVSIGAWSLITRKRAPKRGMFEDIMPVGKKIPFTRGPDYTPPEESP